MVRDESLTVRWSEEELAELQRIAEQEDRTRGYVIRQLVGEALAARREKEQR
jgi:predicted transcriptional regulator